MQTFAYGDIEQGARYLGYATLIRNTEDDPKVERDCLNRLRNGFVDRIIIAGTGRSGRVVRDIRSSGIAVVQIVRQQEEQISSAVADYEACGYDVVRFLYQKGMPGNWPHQRPAWRCNQTREASP